MSDDANGWVYHSHYFGGKIDRMYVLGKPKMDYRCTCGIGNCGLISFARNLSGVKDQQREHLSAAHPRRRSADGLD